MAARETLIFKREQKNLKQEDVAKVLKTSQQNVSLIENGRRKPSLKLAKQFEILFETPMETLFPDIFGDLHTGNSHSNKV